MRIAIRIHFYDSFLCGRLRAGIRVSAVHARACGELNSSFSREDASRLVREFLPADHDPRHVGVKRVDLRQGPLVERLRGHDVDEMEDLHAPMVPIG